MQEISYICDREPSEMLSIANFCKCLHSDMAHALSHCSCTYLCREKNKVRWSRRDTFSFTKQLTIIEELLETPPSDSDVKQITERLGNDISAQEAVPAAVYSFVRNSDKDLEEVTLYAISLGGDTDTIGTMAAAIGGAYFGASKVPTEWKRVCEGVDDAMNYADELFKIFHNDEER